MNSELIEAWDMTEELAIVQHNGPLQDIISALVFSLPHADNLSVSHCGSFGEKFLGMWADHIKQSRSALCSPGLGYGAESLQAMQDAGFYTGPSIAVIMHGYQSREAPAQGKGVITHPLQHIKNHFEAFGVAGFLATGDYFPDSNSCAALVFDVTDKDLRRKLKPDFMARFPDRAAKSLGAYPVNSNSREQRGYALGALIALKELAGEIGAAYAGQQHQENARALLEQLPESIRSKIAYNMQWIAGPLRAMSPVLSPEDKGQLIVEIAAKFANLQHPAHAPQSASTRELT